MLVNTGTVEMYGKKVDVKMSRLTETVQKDANKIKVETGVHAYWAVGD